jgi:uncharacterized protein YkwD
VRHRPVSPPLTTRLADGLTASGRRLARRLRGTPRQQTGRLLLGAAVILAVTALMLTIPVVSGRGDGTSTVALDASSSAAHQADDSSPVVMGVDGAPGTTGGRSLPSSSGTTGGGSRSAAGPDTSAGTSSSDATLAGSSSSGSSSAASSSVAATSSAASSSSSSSVSGTGSAGTPVGGSDTPSSPQSASDGPSAPSAPDAVDQVLSLVNAARATAGCGALVADPALAATARAHSAEMRDRGFFGLVDPVDGSVLDRGARAATIAQGSSDPATVVAGWLADPADQAAIADCSLTSVGVGTASGDGGSWWTQLLA